MRLILIFFLSVNLALDYCSKTIFIKHQTDVKNIKNCTDFKGSILVKADHTPISLSLPQLNSIQGSLMITGSQITTISLPLLTKITQDLSFCSIHDLQFVAIPSLTESYSLQFCNISAIISFEFKAGLKTKQFSMTDTRITSVKGLNIEAALFDLLISNNPLLISLDLASITKVDQSLIFRSNPLLVTALFPSLVEIGHDVSFKGNTRLSKIDLSKLDRVENKLEIVSPNLTDLDLGNYRISSGCQLVAPLDCEKFRALYALSFNYGECVRQREAAIRKQQASKSNQLAFIHSSPLLAILIFLQSIILF